MFSEDMCHEWHWASCAVIWVFLIVELTDNLFEQLLANAQVSFGDV